MKLLLALSVALATIAAPLRGASVLRQFVSVQGDQLVENGKPYRFVSFNLPNLHLVEDNLAFMEENPWRWPDRFEIADALESVRQQGGTVVRTYVLSVLRTNDAPGTPRHVLGPGQFNEEGFRALDLVLQEANRIGVRLIIPFVDNWSWWGGIAEYAGFRGRGKDAFWSDPLIIADFKATIRFVLNRTNTRTGVLYRNDPAILCWETGNELQSPPAWTQEIAAYIKSLDPRHPVMDGYHTTELRPESLSLPEVDIVTTHHYPGGKRAFADLVRANWEKARGRKPYVVGEFGFVETAPIAATLAAVQETGTAGALLWSLRFRNRDGGFYWHSEPSGGNKYKAFHWPGFVTGADYDEMGLLRIVQQSAFAIRGLPVPKTTVPQAPRLLATTNAAALSWQGSVGATNYRVERATHPNGPWRAAGENVDETTTQYRPLFADTTAVPGKWYYRVRARNPAGLSKPSNVVGPIPVRHRTLVDEMMDFSQIHEQQGTLEIRNRDCRKAREDAHRLAGESSSAVVYHLPGPLESVRLYAFFPDTPADFLVAVSADGQNYTPVTGDRKNGPGGAGDYGYWKAALFRYAIPPGNSRDLRITFPARSEISRVEIDYGYTE